MSERLSERDFLRQVRDLAELTGWTALCTWYSRHSPAGEPDLRLIRPPRVIFAELKSEKGRITKRQDEVLGRLRECPGVETYLWRPGDWDAIVKILQ